MKTSDETLLVGFRCHVERDEDLCCWYINNMIRWLEYRNHKIIKYVSGYHSDTGNGHFHLHILTQGHKWSNPFQTFKQDWGSGKLQLIYNKQKELKEMPNSIIGQKYRNRSNISIKMVVAQDETDQIRFLQYPLKEDKPLLIWGVSEAETDELTKVAKIEYATAKQKRVALLNKKEQRLTEWDTLVEMVQKQDLGDHVAVFEYVCSIYKEVEGKPPSIRSIVDISERISMKLGIISIRDLTNKYIR